MGYFLKKSIKKPHSNAVFHCLMTSPLIQKLSLHGCHSLNHFLRDMQKHIHQFMLDIPV